VDIKNLLTPADVIVDVRGTDKEQLLQELSERAAEALGLDAGLVTAKILKREELGSTGMGEGMAIPHARIPKLDKPFGTLVRLKKAIEFAAIDENPVDLVFLLLLPGATEGDQLNALASVARMLRNPTTSSAVRAARDGAEAYEAVVAS
jgi:PTS system nitrogen regulatory IIA component